MESFLHGPAANQRFTQHMRAQTPGIGITYMIDPALNAAVKFGKADGIQRKMLASVPVACVRKFLQLQLGNSVLEAPAS